MKFVFSWWLIAALIALVAVVVLFVVFVMMDKKDKKIIDEFIKENSPKEEKASTDEK